MRIAVITSSFPRAPGDSSNAGVFVADFARKLVDLGVECTVITPQRVEKAYPGNSVRVVQIPWPGQEQSLTHMNPGKPMELARLATLMISGTFTTLRTLLSQKFHHVVAMWAVPSGFLAWVGGGISGVPYTVWTLGSDIWKIDEYPLGRLVLKRVLRGASAVYSNSSDLAERVERISGRTSSVLPTSRILPTSTASVELPRDVTNFLCVARFHRNKGVDVLLKAVALLAPPVRERMRFHVFGGGPERASLERLLLTAGIGDVVNLGGFLDPTQLAAYLKSADCLIMPSRIESLPLLLGDAVQIECPVIATDVGDVGKLVREFGVGTVVPPESPEALADAISRFGPHSEGQKARFHELADFLSVDAVARRVLRDASAVRTPPT